MDTKFWIGIIVVHIILICIVNSRHVLVYDQLINGFYEADASFCEESEIDIFSLFLDNDVNFGTRAGYILMVRGDEFIMNEPITAKLQMHYLNWNNWSMDPTKEKVFTVEFKGTSEDSAFDELDDVFPSIQTLKFYPNLGKIVMFSDDTITAIMYKNGMNSEMKNIIDD